MAPNEQVGSFGKGKEINLVLSATHTCKPCASGCTHYVFELPETTESFVLDLGDAQKDEEG